MKKFLIFFLFLHFGLVLAFAGQNTAVYSPKIEQTIAKQLVNVPNPPQKKQEKGKVVIIVFSVLSILALLSLIGYVAFPILGILSILGDFLFGASMILGLTSFIGGIVSFFRQKKQGNKKLAKLALIPTSIGGFLTLIGLAVIIMFVILIFRYILSLFL